jgi:hypothetical protein
MVMPAFTDADVRELLRKFGLQDAGSSVRE